MAWGNFSWWGKTNVKMPQKESLVKTALKTLRKGQRRQVKGRWDQGRESEMPAPCGDLVAGGTRGRVLALHWKFPLELKKKKKGQCVLGGFKYKFLLSLLPKWCGAACKYWNINCPNGLAEVLLPDYCERCVCLSTLLQGKVNQTNDNCQKSRAKNHTFPYVSEAGSMAGSVRMWRETCPKAAVSPNRPSCPALCILPHLYLSRCNGTVIHYFMEQGGRQDG